VEYAVVRVSGVYSNSRSLGIWLFSCVGYIWGSSHWRGVVGSGMEWVM
jgi:hypothetical protein